MNGTRAGNYGLFFSMWICSGVLSWTFVSYFCARVVTTITAISSIMSESSLPFVGGRDNPSVAWFFASARLTMSKSYSIGWRCNLASLPVTSAKLRIHFSAWWWVQTVNLVPYRYGYRSRIAQRLQNTLEEWCLSFYFRRSRALINIQLVCLYYCLGFARAYTFLAITCISAEGVSFFFSEQG